ncbi:hypothetical protein EMCRGX_G022355 [Ephydatia muelleri]
MSVSVELNGDPGDLGTVLAKVQDDLHRLREKLRAAGDAPIDLQPLETAIERTEQSIKASAEKVIHSYNNRVTILPAVSQPRETRSSEASKSMQQLVETSRRRSPLKQGARATQGNRGFPTVSPGQQFKLDRIRQLLARPSHPVAKQALDSCYGIRPTTAARDSSATKRGGPPPRGQLATGVTVERHATLPRANRRDALLTPPPISNQDAQKGLLSLLERGLIPPAAEIILSPPLVAPRSVHLHGTNSQLSVKQTPVDGSEVGTNWVGVKLDLHVSTSTHSTAKKDLAATRNGCRDSLASKKAAITSILPPEIPEPKATPIVQTPQPSNEHKLVIQNGHVVDSLQPFQEYRQANVQGWFSIERLLQRLEELGNNYALPIIFVNGNRLSELALHYELELKPSRTELLSCIDNGKEIIQLLRMPGRRYKGAGGLNAAAAKIQATYRMYVKRRIYLEHRRMKWAAGVITMSWLMYIKMCQVRKSLKQKRAAQLELMQRQQRTLRLRWLTITRSPRVVVHIPSQGYPHSIRTCLDNFSIRQSLQMARICDVRDPDIEVIYVSPIPIKRELDDYYRSLLGMGPGGDVAMERVHMVTPEHCSTFTKHQMALASVLLYSHDTMTRIRTLTAGKEAYIVSNVVSPDDLSLADQLGIPLLGCPPDIGRLYSSRSGAKRVFADAQVSMPPSQGDIFSEEQLIEHLATLILANLAIQRWLFKLNSHVQGKGFAICDVAKHLECYSWVVRESQRYGEKWDNRWAQEYSMKRVMEELPQILSSHAQPVDRTLFRNWRVFLDQFLAEGGVIEGTPPSDSVTPLTVGLFIDPTGAITVQYTGDQLCSTPYNVWGITCPQTSVPPEQLVEAVRKVAVACQSRGLVGHLSIDFVTFLHPTTLSQELWGIDLDIGYSDHLALFQLLSYITGATFDSGGGRLLVDGGTPRYAVMSSQLYHTNMAIVHYPVFFKMCKAHHIGYDAKEKQGTLFNFIDESHREYLTMICLKDSLQKALDTCSTNLSVIHQEISTPNQQGQTNFESVCVELDKITSLMNENISNQN